MGSDYFELCNITESPHIENNVKKLLCNTFGSPAINKYFPNSWTARSPDMNTADFWLWDYFNKRVFLSTYY